MVRAPTVAQAHFLSTRLTETSMFSLGVSCPLSNPLTLLYYTFSSDIRQVLIETHKTPQGVSAFFDAFFDRSFALF